MVAKKQAVKKARPRKRPATKNAAKKPVTVMVCPACFSNHVLELPEGFVCQRCGQVSKQLVKRSSADTKALIAARKKHLVRQHRAIRDRHTKKVLPFLERYHLRLWFEVISTIILAGGIVLLFSAEAATGALFTIIGIIGLWHAVTSL